MKHLLFETLKVTGTTLLGLAFTLGAANSSLAKSTLVSVSVEPQWPSSSQPGSVVLYTVTVTRAGEGELELALSSAGLPPGVSASFSQNPIRFTGRTPKTLTSTLTMSCTNLTATDNWAFTVTATGKNETMIFTNPVAPSGTLTAAAQAYSAPTLALDRLSATNMWLRGQGASGQTYQVQCTQSLNNPAWTTAGASTADGNGRFSFFDTNSNLPPARFYRVVLPTP